MFIAYYNSLEFTVKSMKGLLVAFFARINRNATRLVKMTPQDVIVQYVKIKSKEV